MSNTNPRHNEPITLRLRWDGEAEGLRDHHLSITDFGEALIELNRALQRIASDIVSNAGDTDPHELTPLRSDAKKLLGLDLVRIEDGCVQLVFEVKAPGDSHHMRLPESASHRLLNDIQYEARGIPVNRGVRRFLQKMPPYVSQQTYTLFRGEQSFASAHINEVDLVETPAPAGGLFRVSGTVKGVNFSPYQIKLELHGGGTRTCIATKELVHQAFGLQERPIEAMLLYRTSRAQVVWIRDRRQDFPLPTEEERDQAILEQWGNLLRRLPND